MHRSIYPIILTLIFNISYGQENNRKIHRVIADSTGVELNMDATYNRPFLTVDKMPVAVGGYIEANSLYTSTDGVSEGLSFQARRLTLFLSSTIMKRIKFLTEIEFEDGTKDRGFTIWGWHK